MSQENVEVVRRAYEHRHATGDFLEEIIAPDFVGHVQVQRLAGATGV